MFHFECSFSSMEKFIKCVSDGLRAHVFGLP